MTYGEAYVAWSASHCRAAIGKAMRGMFKK